MKHVVFADQWQLFWEKYGYRKFEDFFDNFEGVQINKNTKRSVLTKTINTEAGPRTFFLKRFFNPHFKDMVFALYNWHGPCSQGRLEWNSANYLLSHGIGAYRPVCFGEVCVCGIERRSFFATEKLAGQCLTDYFSKIWKGLSSERQEQMLVAIAGFLRKIHTLRVSLPDLYVYHLFIDQHGDQFSLAVIDLHRMSVDVPAWRMPACRIENLARLNFSLRDEYITSAQRTFMLQQSLSDLPQSQIDMMAKKIVQRSLQIARRRKQPVY